MQKFSVQQSSMRYAQLYSAMLRMYGKQDQDQQVALTRGPNKVQQQEIKSMPRIIYGTAWKKTNTTELVMMAVRAGFRGIDTAGQPKHYNESGVGEALQMLLCDENGDDGGGTDDDMMTDPSLEAPACVLHRRDLYLQTKFTPLAGQNQNLPLPYDLDSPLAVRVSQSVRNSLRNLHTSYVDALVLHSPMPTHEETLCVWRAMEQLVAGGVVRILGVSNMYNLERLRQLWRDARVKPSIVQNRFYAKTNYDAGIRDFCKEESIVYQSFWTLTANKHIVNSSVVTTLAEKYHTTKEALFLSYVAHGEGLVPLTGTTSIKHMQDDLSAIAGVKLEMNEIMQIRLLFSNNKKEEEGGEPSS